MSFPVIDASSLQKTYFMGDSSLPILKQADLKVNKGEFVAIVGRSGSGKSTLLQILGLLDSPDSGSLKLNGQETVGMSDAELSLMRSKSLGFVFQAFFLLPHLSVLENAMLPLEYAHVPHEKRKAMAEPWLVRFGLEDRLHHRPARLSGGERQRVALARAMVNRPPILLADEPTGNLDTRLRDEVLEELIRLKNEEGTTLILVTHDPEIGRLADRAVTLREGAVVPL